MSLTCYYYVATASNGVPHFGIMEAGSHLSPNNFDKAIATAAGRAELSTIAQRRAIDRIKDMMATGKFVSGIVYPCNFGGDRTGPDVFSV